MSIEITNIVAETKDEARTRAVALVKKAKANVNQWSVRDTLKSFTEWGFWIDKGGSVMASIDVATAKKICDVLIRELKRAPHFFIDDVNQSLGYIERQ